MKKFFIILAAAALFAACEKEETPKEPTPEPKFSETTVMAEQKTLNISGTVADFTFVSQDATAVGVWYAAVDKEEKTEAAGTIKDGKITGSFKDLAYGEYAAGVYAEVEGKKYYSDADYACIIEHAKIDGYETVELAGNTWFKSNLHFLPTGVEASADPAKGYIWYPYSINGKVTTAIKDEASVKELGHLYNYFVALGISRTKINKLCADKDEKGIIEYLKTFEGAQGICPDGWHLPTVKELTALNGERIGVNDDRYPEAERAEVIDENAPFYDAETKIGKIEKANTAGFNIKFPGLVNNTKLGGKGTYLPAAISSKCPTEAWVGKPSMNGFIGSSLYLPHKALTNIQFWGLQTTFAGNYPEGGMQVNHTNIEAGYSIRCVRNK